MGLHKTLLPFYHACLFFCRMDQCCLINKNKRYMGYIATEFIFSCFFAFFCIVTEGLTEFEYLSNQISSCFMNYENRSDLKTVYIPCLNTF